MQRIVITGATGLIGSHLSPLLEEEGYDVVHLTRDRKRGERAKAFLWDPSGSHADSDAFRQGDIIIHLAGANLGSGWWTGKRKEEIISSRVNSAALLFSKTAGAGIIPSAYITASASGYYGAVTTERIFTESDPPAADFLGETCRSWEEAAQPFVEKGVRVVKIRTSVVLAPSGSALSKLKMPAAAGLIVRPGPGGQYFPWIHIDDLCAVYLAAIREAEMSGAYNAVAPDHVTLDGVMKEIARQKHLPVFLPHIPVWLMRAVLGEMSVMITTGSRISPERLTNSGFTFRYPDIASALRAC
jgi:uncharacterized protein (TIGR01777 family)